MAEWIKALLKSLKYSKIDAEQKKASSWVKMILATWLKQWQSLYIFTEEPPSLLTRLEGKLKSLPLEPCTICGTAWDGHVLSCATRQGSWYDYRSSEWRQSSCQGLALRATTHQAQIQSHLVSARSPAARHETRTSIQLTGQHILLRHLDISTH